MIGAGVAHFGAAYAEYSKTGDWGTASNNAGISFSTTVTTDFGYDDSKNHIPGVIQNDPIVSLKTIDGNDKAYDFLNYAGIGAESGNFLESSISKSDFLIGSYNSSNAIDFGSDIVPGQFNLYEKGYQESLSQLKVLNRTSKVIGKGGYYLGSAEKVRPNLD